LFTGFGSDYILVGSPSPIDLAAIEGRFRASQAVAEDLRRYNIQTPEGLLARIVQSDAALRRNYGAAPRIRDQHNDLERQLLDPRVRAVVAYEPEDVLAALKDEAPALYSKLAGILSHLGRLRYHVQGYPFETLATVDPTDHPDIALADVDWMAIAALSQRNFAALRAGKPRRSVQILEEMLAIEPALPEVLILLARDRIRRSKFGEAIALLEAFAELEPADLLGDEMLAQAYAADGQPRRASAVLETALDSLPPSRAADRSRLERQLAKYRAVN
jgi:tetratricopeptide (TPR) repeat protein